MDDFESRELGRKREIDRLGECFANPNLSDEAFETILHRRAELIREEAEASGIPLNESPEDAW
jgi:hypothetical protein